MSADILHVPDAERVATSNAWAFLHWLRSTGRRDLDGWEALIAWSAADPAGFTGALTEFAALPPASDRRLIRAVADVLLHADLRPDDRVLIAAGPAWPWQVALDQGTEILTEVPLPPAALLARTAGERASVLVADAASLSEAAFQRPGVRPDLSCLRSIVALGGALAPEVRVRIHTWVKADLLLLARAGDRMWGSALGPVRAHPGQPLCFFRR